MPSYDATRLPFVPLSPNMPTLTTALLYARAHALLPTPPLPSLQRNIVTLCRMYPGLGLLEGTSMSEGRGTCTPFQSVGDTQPSTHSLLLLLLLLPLPPPPPPPPLLLLLLLLLLLPANCLCVMQVLPG